MSYLFFLHIQCNMDDDKKRIYTYVIFGKREDFVQFPQTAAVKISLEGGQTAEFRPVFLFWDKTDEILITFYKRWRKSEKSGLRAAFGKAVAAAVKKHIQNKYKEVFLHSPETLFLSESAEKEILPDFWQEKPRMQTELYEEFGKRMAREVLLQSEETLSLFWVLGEDGGYDGLLEWLIDAEKAAGANMSDVFLFGTAAQKEKGEELLESFYEETGLAGSFCPVSECRKVAAQIKGKVQVVDCLGLATDKLGRPAYYIDGSGVRTGKEMKRLSGVCKTCYSLRNHLDRAFLSAL